MAGQTTGDTSTLLGWTDTGAASNVLVAQATAVLDFSDFVRLTGSNGDAAITQTLTTDQSKAYTVIQFDALALDSWDENSGRWGVSEAFVVHIDGVEAFRFTPDGSGTGYGDGAAASGSASGISWSVSSSGVQEGIHTGTWGDTPSDALHQVNIVLEGARSDVTIGVGSTTNEGMANESLGIANLQVHSSDTPTIDSPASGGSATDGSASGGSATDGTASGGSATDSSASGGSATDSSASGGSATDGTASGGSATDGTASGGSATDGSATDGSATDGSASGGSATDSSASGGSATDSSASGGSATDSSASGGSATDGSASGGSATDSSASGSSSSTDSSASSDSVPWVDPSSHAFDAVYDYRNLDEGALEGTWGASDLFIVSTGDGVLEVDGGWGSWTDVIQLENYSPANDAAATTTTYDAGAWKVTMGWGHEITGQNDTELLFSTNASGKIEFDDGRIIDFASIDAITWT